MNKRTVNPIPSDAKKVFSGKLFSVWQWEQELFDGSSAVFERIARCDYAYIVGVLPDKRILMIEDEQPDRKAVLTPAGGQVEEDEKATTAAKREFLEETGYTVSELTPWHKYRPNSKFEMLVHGFIGKGIRKIAEPKLEAGERIEVKTYTFDEFLELGHEERLRDWMMRIKLLEAKVDPQKRKELLKLLYE